MKRALWSFFFFLCFAMFLAFPFLFFFSLLENSEIQPLVMYFFFFLLPYFLTIGELFFFFSFSLVYFVNENRGLLITRK